MIPQWLAVTLSIVAVCVAFVMIFVAIERDGGVISVIVIPAIVMILGFGSLFWSTSSNYYDVKYGTVIAHEFTPAHDGFIMVGKVLVPQHYDAVWSVVVEDSRGKIGRFHYSEDPFEYYPVGSRYEAEQ